MIPKKVAVLGAGAWGTALAKLLAEAPAKPPTLEPSPAATAVLQPTSGTTGTLKLAQLSHRNLIANAMQVSTLTRCRAGQERVLLRELPRGGGRGHRALSMRRG